MRSFLLIAIAVLLALPGTLLAQVPSSALTLVVIGDSIPYAAFCTECERALVADFAHRLEQELGQEVEVINRSRNDGAVLNQIIEQVETESMLRDQLASADLVIVSAGSNDGPTWPVDHPCGSEESDMRSTVDQMLAYTEGCLDEGVAARRGDLDRLFAAVDEVVPDSSPVLVLNSYDWWTGWSGLADHATVDELAQIDVSIAYYYKIWNEQLCNLANDWGFVCIDVYQAFNGPDGMSPSGDLLEADHAHPSARGNALIADLLMEAWVIGSVPGTPAPA